jgi:hypothetical protein
LGTNFNRFGHQFYRFWHQFYRSGTNFWAPILFVLSTNFIFWPPILYKKKQKGQKLKTVLKSVTVSLLSKNRLID